MFNHIYPLIFYPKKIGQQIKLLPRFQLYGWNYGNTPNVI